MSTYPRPYRAGPIEPVVEPGQNLLLVDSVSYKLYRVAYIEPIPRSHPLVINLGAIAAGITTPSISTAAILDQPYGHLGQFRAAVLDDIWVDLLLPQAYARYGVLNVNATLNAFGALYDPCAHQTEFYCFENTRPFLRARNPTGYALAQARVAFWGYRYVLWGQQGTSQAGEHMPPLQTFSTIEKALASGEKFTQVAIGGW